jgi:serine/threonine protein kinase
MIGQLLVERYLILEKLGTGGFSETYLARDKYRPDYPLCVVKQLKMPAENSISRAAIEQFFTTEARILEKLGQNHEQIPTLLAYCHDPDQVYLVQEYVAGTNLETWITQGRRLATAGAIALLVEVLPILDYLHSQQIIHQDIKPSNLIHRDDDGKIVLIDFGAAQLLSPEGLAIGRDAALGGSSGAPGEVSEAEPVLPSHAIGTPGYMPPEQSLGQSQVNSDLFALGMLVIHLVTGIDPAGIEPDPISGELDWHGHPGVASLDAHLVAILDRMVRMSFRDRYPSAPAVLAALETLSSPRTPSTKRWFTVPRGRVLPPFLKVAAVIVLVVGGVGGTYGHSHNGHAEGVLSALRLRPRAANAQLVKLHDLPITAKINRMMIAPNNQVLVTAGADQILRLWALPSGARLKSLTGVTGTVTALDISPDSRFLISSSSDNTISLWNLASGRRVWTRPQSAVTAVAISPDAKTLLTGSQDGKLYLWNLQTGLRLKTLDGGPSAVTVVVYGSTPDQMISANRDRQIHVWNLQTGNRDRTFTGHTDTITGLKMKSPKILVSYGKDRTLFWDLKREELVQILHQDADSPIATSLNNQTIMTVHNSGSIRLWTSKSRQPPFRELGKLSSNLTAVFSPNQRYLACWTINQPLHLWQINPEIAQ